MHMLRWMCGHTRSDRVWNDDIRDRIGVAPIAENLVQHRLRWFGHIQRVPPDALVYRERLERAENIKRGRGRPNLTWEESVKRDLKDWSITKELAVDRAAWKLAIYVPEPWVGYEIVWVSPLAYPNLFGTKGLAVQKHILSWTKAYFIDTDQSYCNLYCRDSSKMEFRCAG
jgi:hypothetical protein